MKNKRTSIIFDICFMLVGLVLAILTLISGVDSTRDWFSLILGAIVAIVNFMVLMPKIKERKRGGHQDK